MRSASRWMRIFSRQTRGLVGAEKALLLAFALAIIAIVGVSLRGGASSAGQDAQRALASGTAAGGIGAAGGLTQVNAVLGEHDVLAVGAAQAPLAVPPAAAQQPVAPPVAQQPPLPPVAVRVPPVVNVAAIADPVARNQAINQSYHALDTAMNSYLGSPNVANWTTFGQHASREAGTQIRNLDEGLDTLNNALNVLKGLTSLNPVTMAQKAPDAVQALRRVLGLLQQDGMIPQLLRLSLQKAGITQGELQALYDDLRLLTNWTSAIPGLGQVRQARVAIRLGLIAGKLALAIPSILQSANKIRDNMIRGNREIYENIAPAYAQYLAAANAAPDGIPPRQRFANDPKGFLAEAFSEYSEVRRLGLEIRAAQDPATIARLTAEREARANRANLLIGFQEQLVILQPIFNTMQPELRAIAGTMALNDPRGRVPLLPNGGNWGDFYTRMGIDPARAPRDPQTITPNNLPPLLNPRDPRFQGTIGQYFQQGLPDPRIHRPPPSIGRF